MPEIATAPETITRGGNVKKSEIVYSKETKLGNELGQVPIQPVVATLKVTRNAAGEVTKSGYNLKFPNSPTVPNSYISSGDAEKAGFLKKVGNKPVSDSTEYAWSISELGFQPNIDPAKRGQWTTK